MKKLYTSMILHITMFEARDLLTASSEVESVDHELSKPEDKLRIKSPIDRLNDLLN